jgi:hypothetical protein
MLWITSLACFWPGAVKAGAMAAEPIETADHKGPGGRFVPHPLYQLGKRIPLVEVLDLPGVSGEALELSPAARTGAPAVTLLNSNGPHLHNDTQYHPWPHVRLLSAPTDSPQHDYLIWSSRITSEAYPPGGRPSLFRVRISRDRRTDGRQEQIPRSGPGSGHAMYLGVHLLEDDTNPTSAVVAGESYVARPSTPGKPEIGDGYPVLTLYELGPTMRVVKEVYYGDRIADLPGVKSFWEQNAFIVRGGPTKALHVGGAFELVHSGGPSTLCGHVTRLRSDPKAPDFLHPESSWIIAREGFSSGDQTMLSGLAADVEGNLFVVGRSDANAEQ